MVHPSTLDMPALKLIEFFKVVQEKPVYICDICWKPEWKGNRLQLTVSRYTPEMCNRSFIKKLDRFGLVTNTWRKIKYPCKHGLTI